MSRDGYYQGSYGSWYNCAKCGKLFFVTDPGVWAYKRKLYGGKDKTTVYFHTWSCMRSYTEEYEANVKQKQRVSHKKIVSEHNCTECFYCKKDPYYMNYYCTAYQAVYVYKDRNACPKFKPKK